MILRDWRQASPETMATLHEEERRRWLRILRWDPAPAWREVEIARTTWGLPGFLAVDDRERVRGTAFFLHQENRVEIGGITADDPEATRLLLEGIFEFAASVGAE